MCDVFTVTVKRFSIVRTKGSVDHPASPANAGQLSKALRITEPLFTVLKMSPHPLHLQPCTVMLRLYILCTIIIIINVYLCVQVNAYVTWLIAS